ncbi:hypothetical protein T440DRAFT_224251 [Plenodomus tracheiphilus IPT5]|uniref:Uncharacterized protein n=1 Tax=Plenodomus tracheiphilus IPT5 TaxID=1408161 RepID=A0A6A7ATG4_9PLEO|nr:hypothetical protein T440DRAFT_224251 [Plenodomus tracheiphilus IPT5]
MEGAWYSQQGYNGKGHGFQTKGQDMAPWKGEVMQLWLQPLWESELKRVVDVVKSRGAKRWQALAAAEVCSLKVIVCRGPCPRPTSCVIRNLAGAVQWPLLQRRSD